MVSAVILVNTDVGATAKVLREVMSVKGVEEAHALCSVYDLMIKVKASSAEKLREIITYSIRKLGGVSNVMTLLLAE